MARALNSTACDAVYDVACGHGLVGLLVAYRYPKINLVSIDRERRPAFKAWSTAMQSVKSRTVGLDAPSQHALSQLMLPNVEFLEGDFQQLDLLDMLTSAPSLVLCVHGCNEVNRDAVELARKASVGWVAIPCCLRVELYLSVEHFKLPDELRYAVLCGAMASCYQAKSVAVIDRRITNRAIVLTGGLTEVSTRLQEAGLLKKTPPTDLAAAVEDLGARLDASNHAQYSMADQLQRQQLILDQLLAGQAHQNELMLTQLHATVASEQRAVENETLLLQHRNAAAAHTTSCTIKRWKSTDYKKNLD